MLKTTKDTIIAELEDLEIIVYDKNKDKDNLPYLELKEKEWYETGPAYKLLICSRLMRGGERKTVLERGNEEELRKLKYQLEKLLKEYSFY